MSLTKKDLGQIKGAVKETVADAMKSEPIKNILKETVSEVMESKSIKKLLKGTVLEVMEPMMVANQNEFAKIDARFEKIDERFNKIDERFTKIDERFEKIDERFNNLEATLKNQYPDKDYLIEKLGDLAADIGARIERKKEQEERFKRKMIEILERGHLATKEEILYLEKLI